MTPALRAGFIIKHRDGVRRLAVAQQLLQRMQAGIDTRRSLHRVYAADEVERIDNQQMNRHGGLPCERKKPLP